MPINRRLFVERSAQAAMILGFLTHLLEKEALAKVPKFTWEKWVAALQDAGDSLIAGKISPAEWQQIMDKLYAAAPLAQLAKYINVPALLKNTEVGELGEKFVFAPVSEHGVMEEKRRVMITKAAIVTKDRSIPPHAHENMVSAFLTLHGQFNVRQFDKIATTADSLVIKAGVEELQKPGRWSSVSDEKSNCHNLKAVGGDALLFSTKVVEVKPGVKVRGRVYFDPDQAKPFGDGYLRVPIITGKQAFAKT